MNIEFENEPEGNYFVSIYDMNGKLIDNFEGVVKSNSRQSERYNLGNLSAGLYIFWIISPSGKQISQQIVKQ